MDRPIVYPGAIPLETDLLSTARDSLIGLGVLSMDMVGTQTLAAGLPCVPGPGLEVSVGAGRIYAVAPIDATPYSSLPANANLIVKQGLNFTAVLLNCPAPTSGSVNYLIEATYADADTSLTTLPYYNASNPSQAYAGPLNNGQAQATVRQGQVILKAKAGAAAASGSQVTSAADAGYIGLYVVTVAAGQSQIVAANIVAITANFLLPGPYQPLGSYLTPTGMTLLWSATPNLYYKLATLPTSQTWTADSITIKATLNVNDGAVTDTIFEGIFGNRGGFCYVYNLFGPYNPATSIQCFAETDGTTSVYAVSSATYAFANITILNSGGNNLPSQPILYPSPPATMAPTGSLCFSSAQPTVYPPLLNLATPLLTQLAAYLPLAGGTLYGPLTIANDLSVWRNSTGGVSGVVNFNKNASAYLYYDGNNFYFTSQAGSVFSNGAALATAASVTAAIATDQAYTNSKVAPLATTAALTAAVAPLATAASVTAAITTAETFAKGSYALTANGYEVLPSGKVNQWGIYTSGGGSPQSVTFPVAFPTACFAINIVPVAGYENLNLANPPGSSKTGFTVNVQASGVSFSWTAQGH